LIELSLEKNKKIKYTTNYYPWKNGLAKSTNKNLVKILKKTEWPSKELAPIFTKFPLG